MSNYLAIATVTATLYDILTQSAQEVVPGARVTMDLPSDMANDRSGRPRINLYLYQITPNAAWRNADLPTRRSDGAIVHSPQAAVNLQYLLTFFGDETQFVPQRLLGKTVSALHSRPVLTRQEISAAIRELADAGQEYMRESDLADQMEQVKFSPVTVDLKELSGFWSALYQVPYSLSLIYEASVVLIESPETPQPVLPARQPSFRVPPFTQGSRLILKDDTMLLKGRQLGANVAYVAVGDLQLTPTQVNHEISVALSGESLCAGAQGARVVYSDQTSSNLAAFVLHPRVLSVSYSPPGPDGEERILTVETDVIIRERQRIILMLNEVASEAPASYSTTVAVAAPFAGGRTINIPVSRQIKTGTTYLVRVQIDEAESPLMVDTDPDSPTFNQYISPAVDIP
jgi:hypothetical protein